MVTIYSSGTKPVVSRIYDHELFPGGTPSCTVTTADAPVNGVLFSFGTGPNDTAVTSMSNYENPRNLSNWFPPERIVFPDIRISSPAWYVPPGTYSIGPSTAWIGEDVAVATGVVSTGETVAVGISVVGEGVAGTPGYCAQPAASAMHPTNRTRIHPAGFMYCSTIPVAH